MSTLTTYSTGTVAVTTGGAVTVTGGIWSGTNVVAGDKISVDGGATVLLSDVTDVTHGQIAGWTGGAVSGESYVVYQDSSLRFDDVQIAQDLQKQVAALNTTGFIVFVPSTATAPDPSLGDDGQYAFQPSTGKWWAKSGGLWGVIGSPYGLQPAANLSDVSSLVTAKDNISVWGSDVASTATVNLDAATGDLIDVTGTTTITAITLSSGRERTVRFSGALTLTHSASLILPGAANIVTATGDFAVFRGYGSATRCVGYSRASGLPVVDGTVVKVQKFTSSGTYTPDAKLRYCVIECVGGGGAGGGVALGTTRALGGAGGGSGGYTRTTASAATIGISKTVTVGAAGAGGTGSSGGAGGNTSVGSLCVAIGGAGGELSNFSTNFGLAGAGGTSGTGDVAVSGNPGENGEIYPSASTNLAHGGAGGASYFGGGGRQTMSGFSPTNGNAGSFGGGGSGAAILASSGTAAGGNGGAGFVVITEFCSG
jgi:hypothetical protein